MAYNKNDKSDLREARFFPEELPGIAQSIRER